MLDSLTAVLVAEAPRDLLDLSIVMLVAVFTTVPMATEAQQDLLDLLTAKLVAEAPRDRLDMLDPLMVMLSPRPRRTSWTCLS